jgi:hypothetical protein
MRHQKANDFAASPRATWLRDFSAECAGAGGQGDTITVVSDQVSGFSPKQEQERCKKELSELR